MTATQSTKIGNDHVWVEVTLCKVGGPYHIHTTRYSERHDPSGLKTGEGETVPADAAEAAYERAVEAAKAWYAHETAPLRQYASPVL